MKNTDDTRPVMYLMTGIPASGKSSFCRTKPFMQTIISLDRVKTRARERSLIEEAFVQGASFTVDNTNVTREERAVYIQEARKNGYKVVGYYLKSVVKECLERNRKREGKARVPDKAILSKSKQLELPSPDEGYDQLWYVYMEDGQFKELAWKEE